MLRKDEKEFGFVEVGNCKNLCCICKFFVILVIYRSFFVVFCFDFRECKIS